MSWSHYNPVRVISGAGSAARLAEHLPDGALLLLTTAGMQLRGAAAALAAQAGPARAWTVRLVGANPDLDHMDRLVGELCAQPFSAIVALGGGSVIDAAKALSVALPACAAACAQGAPAPAVLDRTLRQRLPLDFSQCLPVLCLPTTAGTGAEVTPFATIWDGAHQQKHSLADDALFPALAILDPALTLTLPWRETLHSALDASSHALETLWNRHATPVSGALALQALEQLAAGLPRVQAAPDDLAARQQLQQASTLAGMAISQSRTALAHSISYPLTARYGVPHGLACSFTLAALMEWVEREQAWRVPLPPPLRRTLLDQLRSYELGRQVLTYCSRAQLLDCLPDMFNPQRAANFCLPATSADVLRVLEASLPPPG
jgi:alcohol dehydrogenase